jgi:hypothetical protein
LREGKWHQFKVGRWSPSATQRNSASRGGDMREW